MEKFKMRFHDNYLLNIPEFISNEHQELFDIIYTINKIVLLDDLCKKDIIPDYIIENIYEDFKTFMIVIQYKWGPKLYLLTCLYIENMISVLLNDLLQNEYYEAMANIQKFNKLKDGIEV
jgi:hypothetical protein